MRHGLDWAILLALFLVSVPALAGESELPGTERSKWGLRVGLGTSPDQIIGGAQFLETPIAKNLWLVPSAAIGVGDDHVIIFGSAPFHYRFRTKTNLRPYAGGGVTIGFDHRDHKGDTDTDLDIALRATGGVIFRLKSGREMFGELNVVFGDFHDLLAMVGWRF